MIDDVVAGDVRAGDAVVGDVLAVDIGGTKIAAALVGADGTVRGRATCPTPAREGAAAVVRDAVALAEGVRGGAPVGAVGIGSAGVIDSAIGVVTHATDALPGWPGTALGAAFAEQFGVPTRVLNDVHAHALGEATHGAGRGVASMLLVAVGTGIGGGYVSGGVVSVGAHAVAGHVGHVSVPEAIGVPCSCGRVGHLEGLASGPGLLAAYRRAGVEAGSTYDVARLASEDSGVAGDLAREVIAMCGRATGRGIGGLLNVLDPAVVVLTGGVAGIGESWWAAVRAGVALEAMDAVAGTPIIPAEAGVAAALQGAAAFARM